jgi:hypothetical protein
MNDRGDVVKSVGGVVQGAADRLPAPANPVTRPVK